MTTGTNDQRPSRQRSLAPPYGFNSIRMVAALVNKAVISVLDKNQIEQEQIHIIRKQQDESLAQLTQVVI